MGVCLVLLSLRWIVFIGFLVCCGCCRVGFGFSVSGFGLWLICGDFYLCECCYLGFLPIAVWCGVAIIGFCVRFGVLGLMRGFGWCVWVVVICC